MKQSVTAFNEQSGKEKSEGAIKVESRYEVIGDQMLTGQKSVEQSSNSKQKFNNAIQTLKQLKKDKVTSLKEQTSQDISQAQIEDKKNAALGQMDQHSASTVINSPVAEVKEQKVMNKADIKNQTLLPVVTDSAAEIDQKQKFQNAIATLRQLKQDKTQREKSNSLPLQPITDASPRKEAPVDAISKSPLKKATTQEVTFSPVKKKLSLIDQMKQAMTAKLDKTQQKSKKEWQDMPSRPASVLKSEKSFGSKKPTLKNKLKKAIKNKINSPVKPVEQPIIGPTQEELVQKINAAKNIAEKLKQEAGNINKIFKREDYMKRLEIPSESILQKQDADKVSCLTPKKHVFDEDGLENQSIGNQSQVFNKNSKIRRLDSVTDGEQSQIRVDIARIVQRQPLFENKLQQEHSDLKISQQTPVTPIVYLLDLAFSENPPQLDINQFKRPIYESNSLLQTTYPVTKIESEKVHFSTDSIQLMNAVRNIDHLVWWTLEKHQNSNLVHLQWICNQDDIVTGDCQFSTQTFQNFYHRGQNLTYSLNWDLPSTLSAHNFLSVEGFPILLNQVLYIQGSELKLYCLKHRYFQLGQDMILTQKELGKLNQNFSIMQHYSFTDLYEQILNQLTRTKLASEYHFQLVFLQFAFTPEMVPKLVKLETGQSESIKIEENAFSALLFKIDKRIRQMFKMRPNHFVKNEQIFKQYWQRITQPKADECTEVARVKASEVFKHEKFESICTETAKPYDQASISGHSAVTSIQLVPNEPNKQKNYQEMSVTTIPQKSFMVEVPKQRSKVQSTEKLLTGLSNNKGVTIQPQLARSNTKQSPQLTFTPKYQLVETQRKHLFQPPTYQLIEIEPEYGNMPEPDDKNNKKESKYDQLDFRGANQRKVISTFKGGNTDQKLGTVQPVVVPDRQIFGYDDSTVKQKYQSNTKDQATSAFKQHQIVSVKQQTYKERSADGSYLSRAPFISARDHETYQQYILPDQHSNSMQSQSIFNQTVRQLDLQKAHLRQINGLQLNQAVGQNQGPVLETTQNWSTQLSDNQRYIQGSLSPINQTINASMFSPTNRRTNNQDGAVWQQRKRSEFLSKDSDGSLFPEISENLGRNDWFAKAMLQKAMVRRSSRPY